MTYKELIDGIIETRGRHGCGEVYHEKHHIKPRCLGGEDKEENYIDLYAREHFIAHELLAKENPHEQGLQCAWWMMCAVKDKNQKRYKCNAEEYEEAKIAMSSAKSKLYKGENNPNYGKHLSKEAKKKISKANKGRKCSESTKKKISDANKGENNFFYGKYHSEETKKKMSKPVICIETGIVYSGATDAEKQTGINRGHISNCCTGSRKSAGKHPKTGEKLHWAFVNE